MAQEKPKKPQSKSKKLNLNTKSKWKSILKDVDKKEVPVTVLEKLMVQLKDGTEVVVNIKQLLADGADPDDIEVHVNTRLLELDDYIENVDFFVDIDLVEAAVQPQTDILLSKL